MSKFKKSGKKLTDKKKEQRVLKKEPIMIEPIVIDKEEMNQQIDESHEFQQVMKDKEKAKKRKHTRNTIFKWVVGILILLILATCVWIGFTYRFNSVGTDHMSPTLSAGDKIIAQEKEVERFRVVQVDHEDKNHWLRVIGVPGDKVRVEEDRLFINDREYDEPYLETNYLNFKQENSTSEKDYTPSFTFDDLSLEEVVPEEHYFLLADNREFGDDSRSLGFLPKSVISETAIALYTPFSTMRVVK